MPPDDASKDQPPQGRQRGGGQDAGKAPPARPSGGLSEDKLPTPPPGEAGGQGGGGDAGGGGSGRGGGGPPGRGIRIRPSVFLIGLGALLIVAWLLVNLSGGSSTTNTPTTVNTTPPATPPPTTTPAPSQTTNPTTTPQAPPVVKPKKVWGPQAITVAYNVPFSLNSPSVPTNPDTGFTVVASGPGGPSFQPYGSYAEAEKVAQANGSGIPSLKDCTAAFPSSTPEGVHVQHLPTGSWLCALTDKGLIARLRYEGGSVGPTSGSFSFNVVVWRPGSS